MRTHSPLRWMAPMLCAWLAACAVDDGRDIASPQVGGGDPATAKLEPVFDPDNFVEGIDHPYLAFEPDKIFRYSSETEDGVETIEVTVTRDTKEILTVVTTVVHDVVRLDGVLVEDTYDWYAQDEDGNVWYFGEDSKEYDNGDVSTEGSWEAGKNGALPGVLMPAPDLLKIGLTYQQEFAPDEAEDMAQVLSFKKSVSVPYDDFENCLQTMEWSPLEPGAREFKYYAYGVGLVLEVSPSGGLGRVELTDVE